ncbi:MAG: alpha/beta hydrolase [Caulobacterales bacterium]|jgi:pimeloyl-ACP methyl ester carboxylesterase|nr:alpha/beta hydrolase [Caulobacterales bacterium]
MGFGQIEAFVHEGVNLAFERQSGAAPTFVWLGGFKSDMAGTKAQRLAEWAHARGQSFVRFDYSGHGQSGGAFADGTIGAWAGDAIAVIDKLTAGPLVLVGSSMGGWISLIAARARPERIAGLLLIAPAADFTERLMWASFPEDVRKQIMDGGRWERPSAYDPEPYVITRSLIEDGRRHLVMDGPTPFAGPVRMLQGGRDPDVPAAHTEAIHHLIDSPNKDFILIGDGDHRLSRPQDLDLLTATADELARLLGEA